MYLYVFLSTDHFSISTANWRICAFVEVHPRFKNKAIFPLPSLTGFLVFLRLHLGKSFGDWWPLDLKSTCSPSSPEKKVEKDSTGVIKLSYDLIIHLGQIKEYKYLTSLSDLPRRFASTNGGSVWFDLMPTWLDFYVLWPNLLFGTVPDFFQS